MCDLFQPEPVIYWLDFTVSAVVGWAAFILSLKTPSVLVWALLTVLSVLALYRAVLFTHELVHIRREHLPGFRPYWNTLCGIPLLVPSFLYDGVHQEHHFRNNYGTPGDGEYMPFARPPRMRIVLYLLSHLLLPPLIFLRFGVLGPLSWLSRKARKMVWEKLSSLSIDHSYRRSVPAKIPRSWIMQESLCALYVWLLAAMIYFRAIPLETLFQLYCVSVAILLLNAMRTLAAHRYAGDGQAMSFESQLADSVNIVSGGLVTSLLAPVGLRYHALHHLFPTIPYHNLARAHRRLVRALPDDLVYMNTFVQSVWQALYQLWSACASRAVRPRTRASA